MNPSHKESFFRLSAWITLQALVAVQILPPFAYAYPKEISKGENLRAETREGTSASGLEEALISRPSQGFATRINEVRGAVQVARRSVGRLQASASWDPKSGEIAGFSWEPNLGTAERETVEAVLDRAQRGLAWLSSKRAGVSLVRKSLQGTTGSVRVEFRANHGMTLDFDRGDKAIRLDTTIAKELFDSADPTRLSVLYGTGFFYQKQLTAGRSPREAAHLTLALYQNLTEPEQKALLSVLKSPQVDHGNQWAFFFEQGSQPRDEFNGEDTLTLEKRLDKEPDLAVRQALAAVINHRDKLVSWLMGQQLIDLPYDRTKMLEAMHTFETNVDAGRAQAYDTVRNFDRQAEQANAERVGTMVREEWLPDNMPYPTLVAGRASRAFGNQAYLMANAVYVEANDGVRSLTQELETQAKAEQLLADLKTMEARAPAAARQEFQRARQRVEALLVQLGPGIARARLLASGQAAALTQYKGALGQIRENIAIFYREASAAIERARSTANESSGKGVRRAFGRNLSQPFETAQARLSRFAGQSGTLVKTVNRLETEVLKAPAQPAAYSVLLQRPSPTGSINFNANELAEKPEQEPALRELVRLGGQNSYISPSYDWVSEATDIIEAAPLFIYERTVMLENGKTVTVFEVDQEGLEQTVRQMADYWALNIDKTIDSEHSALAREIVVAADAALSERARQLTAQGLSAETAHRQAIYEASETRPELLRRVGAMAAWLAAEFDRRISDVERNTEREWQRDHFIDRMESLRDVVVSGNAPAHLLAQAESTANSRASEVDRLTELALRRRRPMPAFHLLTTQAPGLVQGFFQAVLEEEMALRNVAKAKGLDGEVKGLAQRYRQRVAELGRTIIQEFGYQPILEQNKLALPAGMPAEEGERQAIQRTIADHIPLQKELAKLAVLVEFAEAEGKPFDPARPDPAQVEQIIDAQNNTLKADAVREVWQRNQLDPDLAAKVTALDPKQTDEKAIAQVIDEIPIYQEELQSTVRWMARQQAIEQLSKAHPDLHLQDRAKRWYRDHTSLAQTTARRETIAAHHMQALLMDPRYAYSNGALKESSEGHLRPTGARKRYHLIYGPSRVNLGAGERDSVEVWPQWVGVTDPLAAAHALAFYQLINFNPEIRTIMEAENLKVSENQWTAMVRAVRNAEAYFVGRLGVGDIEDLAHQFNRRNGLPGAWLKDGESYAAGPTTGYCIPKDLLFKLFVATAQDDRKMSQIGIPRHLHAGVFQMMSAVLAAQSNFDTVTEWEAWAVQQILNPGSLQKRFGLADGNQLGNLFSQYISVTGGLTVFHLTKLLQIMQMVGIPSPALVPGKDLHAALWAQWADLKLTLPAEQVNRSLVFPVTREIPDGVAEARRLNPGVRIAEPEQSSIHFFGTYKGDDKEPPPPDVRFSWVMRAFMILSGYGREVALSLDEDGQMLARLSWDGFLPDSPDREDQAVVRYLAQKTTGKDQFGPEDAALVEKLKQDFPHHTTVGNITITVVRGVSAEDLLGFNAETKLLLGDRAAEVRGLIQSKGINAGQITANAVLRREFPKEWVPLADLSAGEQTALNQAVAGGIHPLVLQQRGPGTDFKEDLQAQDVAVFSVTHPEIVEMDPSELRDLMQLGRPAGLQSALVAIDVVAQGRHRVWFDRDVMLWYAAARGIDAQGNPIKNWSDRDTKGRKSVYKAFGYGEDTYRPLLGTDLRQEVARQERRAAELYEAVRAAADSSAATQTAAVENLRWRFSQLLPADQLRIEAEQAIQYEQTMLSFRRSKPRDQLIRQSLAALASGKPANQFDFTDWLAIGGMYLLNGAPTAQQKEVQSVFERAGRKMASGLEENSNAALLIRPRLEVSSLVRTEKKGEMFSVKAGETFAEKAIARRKELALQAARQAALQAREEGFRSVAPVASPGGILSALNQARAAVDAMASQIGQGTGNAAQLHRESGRVMGTAAAVLTRLNEELTPVKDRKEVGAKIRALSKGRELDAEAWSSFGGTYENAGILARFFEQAGPERREQVMAAMELLYLTMLMDKTAEFAALPAEDVDARQLWRALAVYYAETIDDHFYEYNPWAFDPKRGSAFVDYYDDVGVLKPEHREELYGLSWAHHRAAYRYIRALVKSKTDYGKLPPAEYNALLGDVALGAAPEQDQLTVQGIGAGAPGSNERLWRAYNQYREIAVMQNDGFAVPAVFNQFNPNDQAVMDAQHRLNFAFISPVGRTHYSRAMMSAARMGSNIFITRAAAVGPVAGSKGPVAAISDAQFWLTESQYREALIRFRGMSEPAADAQIAQDRKAGKITPLGIRVAARFTEPVVLSSGVYMHHHSIEPEWIDAGYPAADKSPVLFNITYDKALYPGIYNPASDTGVHLPPEIDWMHDNTISRPEADVKHEIARMLKPFAQEHGIIVVKGSAESGARNFKRFDLIGDNGWNEKVFNEAVDFIYEVSKGQNVTIQRAIIVTPIAWMDPSAVDGFVERQIRDWGVPVNLHRYPKDWVYSTQRIILSAGMPKDLNDLDNPANWEASHPISLSSLQVATNVGRQGTLELLSPDLVRPEFRGQFIQGLEDAGRRSMAAMARYGKKYWHDVYAPAYRQQHGEAPREFDATGVPYWWPRYLMLDYLAEPVFYRNGREAAGARVVDVIPGDAARGVQARFVLQDAGGERFDGEIRGFKYWLLEPNVGIGLWPNLWKREELHEKVRAAAESRPVDWDRIGANDRVVLGNYLAAGEAFMRAKFGGDHYGPNGPRRDSPPMGPSSPEVPPPAPGPAFVQPPVTDAVSQARAVEVEQDRDLSYPLAPLIEIQQDPASAEQLRGLLPYGRTFAVVTGKRTLMNHHVYPFEVGKGTQAVNVIGVHSDWLTPDGKATRLMTYNPQTRRYLEMPLREPLAFNSAYIVELPQSREVELHRQLTQQLSSHGVRVVNPAGEAQKHMDDKFWLRQNTIQNVPIPSTWPVGQQAQNDEQRRILKAASAASRSAGVVIQPRSGTTEGERVAWFSADDSSGQLAHLRSLLETGDAMVSVYRGNVTVNGRPLVLRLNVVSGQVTSASAVVGPLNAKIASLGQEGETVSLAEALTQLQGPDGVPIAITPQDWRRIQETAGDAASALRASFTGIDLVLETTPEGGVRGVLLEANARPGTLIFGERLSFPEDGPIESHPAAPVGPAFWNQLGVSPKTGLDEQQAATLEEWKRILGDPIGSGFWGTLKKRYGDDESKLHQVLAAYQQLIIGALANGFDPSKKIVVVASPGRDRIFMGHTDSPGLGGFTINVATEEEVLAVLQATDDGQVHLQNADPAYPIAAFPIEEIREVAQRYTDRPELFKAQKIWEPTQWDSYLRAALTFMMAQLPGVDRKIGSSGMRLYVSSVGPHALPATGGVSSSSALTGTISVAMNALFDLGLSLEQLAEVDYGEYLLGKSAGAGDKAAQLFAKRGEVGVVNSFPENFREAVKFPKGLTVLMAESPIPRLSTSDGLEWLRENYKGHAGEIYAWAKDDVLRRFGSRAYVRAVQVLKEALADPARASSVGLSDQERRAVLSALEDGFLRELAAGGKIEQELPSLAGWENRRSRYHLIYRLLKLLPEQESVNGLNLSVRKAALYGLAELERGTAYLLSLRAAVDAEGRADSAGVETHLKQILDLVRWAQDGDRATVDHRNGFQPTTWASNLRNDVSDAAIDGWVERDEELFSIPGGFERSIADFDEIADEANVKFGGKAAMRVAAAGMGGTMAVHAFNEVVPDLKQWLESKGWNVRLVKAGAPTQVIIPPKQPALSPLDSFKVQGSEMAATQPVRLSGRSVRLSNGAWLDAGRNGVIEIDPGVRIQPNTVVKGTVRILKDSLVEGKVTGTAQFPVVLGEGTRIVSHNAEIYPGSILLPVRDGKENFHPVTVYGAQIGDPEKPGPVVIWGGTDLRLGATVRPNSVLGPYVHIGPGSEAKATVWMGADAQKNDSTLAHRAYGGNLIAIPVYLEGTPLDDDWHAQLLERLAALRFGQVVSRQVEKSTRSGPEIRPRVNLVMEMDGKRIPVSVRGINFGNGSGPSNLKSVSGGRKAIGVISAGVVAAVAARVQSPVFVGPDSLIDNGAQVSGMQAAAPGTYVRPIATTADKAFRAGAVAEFQGKSKGADEFRQFLAGLRTLVTLARVSQAGLKVAQDPVERMALKAEIQALEGHFTEIDGFTAKELELLKGTPDAAQIPEFARQAEQLRAAWSEIKSAAGLEEKLDLPAGATQKRLMILTPATVNAGMHLLEGIRPAPGEQLPLAVIVSDGAQEALVAARLMASGLALSMPIVNLQKTGQTLPDAVVDVQMRAWTGKMETFVLNDLSDLRDLGRFLGFQGAAERTWNQWLERQGLGTAA